MIFNEVNGFVGYMASYIDDESIKAVMPEFNFNARKQENSKTWQKWKKENEETGITQKQFAKKYGIVNLSNVFNSESNIFYKEQERELQKRFNAFIAENKEEIYKAQVEAILFSNQKKEEENKKYEEYKKQLEAEHFEKYKEEVSQYLKGQDLAISTLAKDDTKDFINLLLRNGYKVRGASASLVFLYYDAEEKLTLEQVQKIVPYEPLSIKDEIDEKQNKWFGSCRYLMNPVKGVRIPVDAHFIGKEYPEYIKEKCEIWH